MVALATINFSGTALAYTADDPAVVYSCFDTNEDGSFVTETDNETGDVNLVPCEIDHGDNAWMLTSSALVLITISRRSGNILWRSVETKERCQYTSHGVHYYRYHCGAVGTVGIFSGLWT